MAILLTKVRPPQRRKDVLRRVRLIDVLHQNLHRKLTFVSAPAGYGKTTLLVDFASDVDAIVFWYRISPEDNDLVQFVRHIVTAFQQKTPSFGKELEEKLESVATSSDPGTMAIDIINEVENKIEDFSLLVLDDYHLAGENQQIVDFLENFLEHLPDRLRILIGSRSVYGIPTASLYIRDELVTISPDELRFRPEELQKLVLQNHHIRIGDEQAEEFAKRADGWIVAILLALRTMENGVLPSLSGGVEQIYQYLAEEVVNRQSEELRQFMLATSILGDFNEALCNYVLDRKDSLTWLRALEERNLFVSSTETLEGPSYRYHQLFSEFLEAYFAKSQPERMRELHQRAADWHKLRLEWESAINHKLAAGDTAEAAGWMDGVARTFFMSGRQMLIARWVESLQTPSDQRAKAPHLLLYQAKLLVDQSRYDAALELLKVADPALTGARDVDAMASSIIIRGMAQRFAGNYAEALKLANQAQDLLKGRRLPVLRQRWFQAERLKGISFFFQGKMEEAIEHLGNAVEGIRKLSVASEGAEKMAYLYDLAESLNDLGLVHINNGQMLPAQQAFQEALDIHVTLRSNPVALASARNNIAYLHHQVGQYREAWRGYSLALENAASANLDRAQVAILNGMADLLLDVEESSEVKTYLQKALELGEYPESVYTYYGLAKVERSEGNYNEAMNWLRKAASFQPGVLDPTEYETEMGNIYAAMGRNNLALTKFETAMVDWPTDELPKQSQVLAAFRAARLYHLEGDAAKAQELLERALEGSARLGYDQFLVSAARDCGEFLQEMGENDPTGQLSKLHERVLNYRRGKTALERGEESGEIEPTHLEVRAFGTGEIRQNGEQLPLSVWRSSRARALFFYILDRGQARKEDIGLDFWPDFNSGKVSSNFHATLWRVRQALGSKDAMVFDNEYYSLHPSIQVWYDAAEFERSLEEAKEDSLSERERGERLMRALELYQGDYLHDVFMAWADHRREELRSLYLDGVLDLAKIEMEHKHYRKAKSLYEKILDVDPYRDEVHLSLMKCLSLAGSPSAAIAHFREYEKLLRKELNAEPLQELRDFYDHLAVKN